MNGEALREWAHNAVEENPERCPCKGGGWMLSDYDTFHSCWLHNTGQAHPESYGYDDYGDDDPVPVFVTIFGNWVPSWGPEIGCLTEEEASPDYIPF